MPLQSREERDKQREETLLVKDKEKEMDAIKVCDGCMYVFTVNFMCTCAGR